MVSTFDLDKLNSLLKDFHILTNIRITVFDDKFRELVAYPQHLSAFCHLIRTDPKAYEACMKCDRESCQIASHRRKPYTYLCHAGMTESITPLYMGNIIIGYLFLGQIFSYSSKEEGWANIRKCCSKYNIDLDFLIEVCRDRPLISREYLDSASQIMVAVASYLCLERMAFLKYEDLPSRIDAYISEHFTEDIDASHICDKFGIGKTSLYELSNQTFGMGIAQHIRELRMEKARHLLKESPQMRINEVAEACGFHDYNYFITIFKKMTGIPPRQYRKAAGS